ncbi:methyltransferase domain-containing protein [Streptomyces cyaneochromogenes]|uniref:Methyltransferase domain-containing protein n=1 Tax=Streptomyces cyaneochromogenes TaxID=2496836 RepID=A0A3Q9EP71_9ACTN|nr:HemK2/MTQ2 family protein methyltransferase [Streptomyces cyaneochromogenes]AZQ32780.1 methyltransferase domain-containing protein [Streptomyces cyaneochromogenes]
MTTVTLPGVYTPQDDTDMLVRCLRDELLPQHAAVLDVGTGTGAVALAAARLGARVTAIDISWRAALNAKVNALLARLPIRVERGDLLAPVSGRSFDLILSNPPYVPAPTTACPRRGVARAWDAGHDGRLVLDRICQDAPGLLKPGGVLLVVQSALSGPEESLRRLRTTGLRAEIVEHRCVAFGPVLRSRRGWLRDQGLIEGDAEKEELVIIRAVRLG